MAGKPRVFLDSNVIFSGLYSSRGAPARIIDRYADGSITVVLCQIVLDEVVAALRLKRPALLPFLLELLTASPPEIIADPAPADVSRWQTVINDPDDAPILAAAISAQPDIFVTGNTKHFMDNPQVAKMSGLNIMTPSQFIATYQSN
jgi:predicted nucleic acid-binding protein